MPSDLVSVTIAGPTLAYADAFATADVATGADGPAWVAHHPGCGILAITADDRVIWSPLIGPLLASAAA